MRRYDELKAGCASFAYEIEKQFAEMHTALKFGDPQGSLRRAGEKVVEGMKESLADIGGSGAVPVITQEL